METASSQDLRYGLRMLANCRDSRRLGFYAGAGHWREYGAIFRSQRASCSIRWRTCTPGQLVAVYGKSSRSDQGPLTTEFPRWQRDTQYIFIQGHIPQPEIQLHCMGEGERTAYMISADFFSRLGVKAVLAALPSR